MGSPEAERQADLTAQRIRQLMAAAQSIPAEALPQHPQPFASEMAEQYPYRTDRLNSWSPQYVKPASVYEDDQRRAYVVRGANDAMQDVPADLRQDVRSMLNWQGVDPKDLEGPTFSAGPLPPWSGAARIMGLLSPAQALMSVGQMAADETSAMLGAPRLNKEAPQQFVNAIDSLTYPMTAYFGRRPAHLRAYDEFVRQQRSKPMWDIQAPTYNPSPEVSPVDTGELVDRALPDSSPVTRAALAFGADMLTDLSAPYGGPMRQIPLAFAKDAATGAAYVAPFVLAAGQSEANARREYQRGLASDLLKVVSPR